MSYCEQFFCKLRTPLAIEYDIIQRMSDKQIPVVAILANTSLKGVREYINGIANWMHAHRPWRIILQEGREKEQDPGILHEQIDGVIAAGDRIAVIRKLVRRKIPTLLIDPLPSDTRRLGILKDCPRVKTNSRAIGRLAAEYYLERRYRNFAYVAETADLSWSHERRDGFRDALAARGFACAIYGGITKSEREQWTRERPRMVAWLKAQPKPLAVFAAMDGRARLVLDACTEAGLRVPDEVAVLGVDNDDMLCETAFPRLSSIRAGSYRYGEIAAETMDALLSGRRTKIEQDQLDAFSVVTRESTGHDAMKKPILAKALKYIYATAPTKNISAADVITELKLSRRFVEISFRKHIGRSIMDEIRRVKFEYVKELLENTNLSLNDIAEKCDFPTVSQLSSRFRQLFGMTMSEWRKTHHHA